MRDDPDPVAGDVAGDAAYPAPRPQPRRRGRIVRALVGLGAIALILVAAVAGVGYGLARHYDANIERVPNVFSPVPGGSPRPTEPPTASGQSGTNWLLVGTDARTGVPTTGEAAGTSLWEPGRQRADTIMLVHIGPDADKIQLISFPRDSWVDVPGHGKAKINAAFSYGGPALLIATVEQLTGVRIDHFAAVDFRGFTAMVDALGGVDVTIAETVYDPANDKLWRAGTHHLDGEEALLFVRQRYGLPDGDFDRIERQQALLESIMEKVTSTSTLANPLELHRFLEALTNSVSVDTGVDAGMLRSLALRLRDLSAGDVTFMTVPVAGTGNEGGQSVVYLDEARARRLYEAVRENRVPAYLDNNGGQANEVEVVR